MSVLIRVLGLALVPMCFACSSSTSTVGTPAAADGGSDAAASGGGDGCTTTLMGTVACAEYLASSDFAKAESTCTSVEGRWGACPPGKTSGCKYPPGSFGIPGGFIDWYYSAGAAPCSDGGTAVNP